MQNEDVAITIRLPMDIYKRVSKCAKEDECSRCAIIRKYLRKILPK